MNFVSDFFLTHRAISPHLDGGQADRHQANYSRCTAMSAAGKKAAASVAGGVLRMTVPAGKASPQPPIGPALGQRGVNIMDFCKQFNERTKTLQPETPVPVVLRVNPKDRSFSFVTSNPPTSFFLKKAAGISKGASTHGAAAGTVTVRQIYEIAKIKQKDEALAHLSLENICNSVAGSARSMGITVVRE